MGARSTNFRRNAYQRPLPAVCDGDRGPGDSAAIMVGARRETERTVGYSRLRDEWRNTLSAAGVHGPKTGPKSFHFHSAPVHRSGREDIAADGSSPSYGFERAGRSL